MKNNAPIHPNHQIDDQAQRLLASILHTPEWVLRTETPDYGIDYNVERGHNGWLTGQRFFIQLKGKRGLSFNKTGLASYSLKRNSAEYYARKCEQPVFLIIADVKNKKCYYCFLQEWFDTKKPPEKWGDKNKISVYIDEDNNLLDLDKFSSNVENALSYMRDKFPSTVRAAIEAKRQDLSKIDPRWDYCISITENGKNELITMSPLNNQETSFNISISSTSKINDITNSLRTGKPYTLKLGSDTKLEGSPVFQHLFNSSKEGSVQIQSETTRSAEIRLSDKKTPDSFYMQLSGKAYAGTHGVTIESSFHGIIELTTFYSIEAAKKTLPTSMTLTPSLESWWGKPLSMLPYFKDIQQFVGIINQKIDLDLIILLDGVRVTAGKLNISQMSGKEEYYRKLNNFIRVIDAARRVSQKLDLNPVLLSPEKLTNTDAENWIRAAHLLESGRYEQNGAGAIFSGKGMFSADLVKKYKSKSNDQAFRMTNRAYQFKSLGVTVSLPSIRYTLSPSSFDISKSSKNGYRSFCAKGHQGSTLLYEYSPEGFDDDPHKII